MTETTARLALPLLAAGQAQKELTHNEALATIDLLLHPCVEAVGLDVPPTDPVLGGAWIVGSAAGGAWAGHGGAIAGWTAAGWRFAAPREGLAVWSVADAAVARWTGTAWTVGVLAGQRLTIGGVQVVGARGGAIADPNAGATVDTEARGAIGAILTALRTHGLIAG